jgi:hypothetical protein
LDADHLLRFKTGKKSFGLARRPDAPTGAARQTRCARKFFATLGTAIVRALANRRHALHRLNA